MAALRSLLFAPGNDERKLGKVAHFGADAVVADLEDAVAHSEKVESRAKVRKALEGFAGTTSVVRINPVGSELWEEDIRAVACRGLDAIMVPKVEDPAQLRSVDEVLASAESVAGVPTGSVRLLGLIETPLGVARVEDIAREAPPRTRTFCFGQGDFSRELGITLSSTGTELLYARSRIVVAVRAYGLEAPIDGPFLTLTDDEGLRHDSEVAHGLGFQGKIAIYPPQVRVINATFGSVNDAELAKAKLIVAEFERAEKGGQASIQVDGTFVDYPVYERAKQIIALTGEGGA
jgi:citrate lyase subunit beta/citryl-CoA lyase